MKRIFKFSAIMAVTAAMSLVPVHAETSIFDTTTTDVVTIEDNVYTVTSDYATTSLTVTEDWTCFTQDLKQQVTEYYDTFSDPITIIKDSLIPNADHYLLLSKDHSAIVFQHQSVDKYSSLVQNLSSLSESDLEILRSAMLQSTFKDYSSEIKEFHGNKYFVFANADRTNVYYETIVGGVNYDFNAMPWEDDAVISDEIIADLEQIITSFAITPAEADTVTENPAETN